MQSTPVITPAKAISRLREGNARFAAGNPEHPAASVVDREALTGGQSPFATIVSCSDSRVPPEIIFDCGIGELFVIRTAGNILDIAGLGSLFYAVEHLHCPLVVVLGHESCGAVTASLQSENSIAAEPVPIRDLIKLVHTHIPLSLTGQRDGTTTLNAAIEENMRTTVYTLRCMITLKKRIDSCVLEIIPAYYSLSNGIVTFC